MAPEAPHISDTDPAPPALHRLLAIAQSDTGQSRRVANFLLAWWNAPACGGFDFSEFWAVEAAIADDMLAVLGLLVRDRAFPDAYGLGGEFEQLVARCRPHVIQAHR